MFILILNCDAELLQSSCEEEEEEEVVWVNYLWCACSSLEVPLCDNSEWTIKGKLSSVL